MNQTLISRLLTLPIFDAAWVLWLLVGLSVASVSIILERLWFYRKNRVDTDALQSQLEALLDADNIEGALQMLTQKDSLETNVLRQGLNEHDKGTKAVEEMISGATRKERQRYEQNLNFLATVGSNAPFIGLFGTVLGIIKAFRDLSTNMSEASSSVMGGISEALIATAMGLLVAIPAVIAYNYFKARVNRVATDSHFLARVLLAHLKAEQ
jgi:biopolymer transport protein ExbB/TolQ